MYTQLYKRYITVLLLIVYVFNQMDRAIFGILMEPIKRELGLSDTQLGFVGGPALALFYATLGIPIARWADRSHRVNIMSVAIALWSGIVMLSSMVATFGQLVLVRIGVGVGEAGFSAIAQSTIADYHQREERTRALSIFMLALPLGVVASNLIGGWANQLWGWRVAFLIAGAPGLLLALLLKVTVAEPPRERSAANGPQSQLNLAALFVAIWRRRSLRHLAAAQALAHVAISGVLSWIGAFFIRNHGLDTGELGVWLAVVGTVGGSGGIWLGGYLTSRYGAQRPRIKTGLVAVSAFVAVPAIYCVLWSPTAEWAFIALIFANAALLFSIGPTFSLVQELSAPESRATMASVFILIQVLAGGIVGIQLLGMLSDALTAWAGTSGMALRWSMTLLSLLLWAAAVQFWRVGGAIESEAVTPELSR